MTKKQPLAWQGGALHSSNQQGSSPEAQLNGGAFSDVQDLAGPSTTLCYLNAAGCNVRKIH